MSKYLSVGTAFALLAISSLAAGADTGYKGFSQPTTGYEVGIERQVELVSDNKVVQRTFGRLQRTYDWEIYKDTRGSTVDVEVKAGVILGQYKGSLALSDGYGSFTEVRGGVNVKALGLYTFNANKVDPFIGASVEYEFMSRPRTEWQADAVAGLKLNITNNKDLSVRYSHVLAHGMEYHNKIGAIRQDDGYAVALIGTKRNADNTSHSLTLEYERFDKGDMYSKDGKAIAYEPDTDNWLLSYKKTF